MWEKSKMILVTNNERVYEKYKDEITVDFAESYEQVLIKSRDLIYSGSELLSHPQATSLKPNQIPFRSILLYEEKTDEHTKSIMLIEKCIESYRQWQEIAETPGRYAVDIEEDYRTIDLSVIDNMMQRL